MTMEVKRAILTTRSDRTRRILLAALGVAAVTALGARGTRAVAAGSATMPNAANAATSGAAGREPIVLVVGDSLSAGYGLARDEGWVNLLEARTKPLG